MKPACTKSETADYVIRAEGFGSIDTLLTEQDIDPKVAFAHVGLTPDILKGDKKNQNIEYRRFLDLLNYCAEITGRKDFGNLLSYYQDMTVIGLPGRAMYEAPTFRTALEDLIDFFHLHMNGMRVGFQEHGRISLITLEIVMPFSPAYRQQVELSLGIGLRFIRRLLGQDWCPKEAYFEHSKDSGSASTQALFRCPVNYGHEFNGYTFDSSALDLLREQFNSREHQILYDYLCLQTRTVKRDFLLDVREQLIHAMRRGDTSIDIVSDALGLQRRTLQRRLDKRGFHYRELLEHTRMDLAHRYLTVVQIPITQISDILGYADLSSFSRSFRRFFGVSPRTWRKQNVD
jgi:AraC-like DNA-binding protein